jgi:hypothetical protein
MSILYGGLIRFYLPVVPLTKLETLKEDILNLLTSEIISGDLGDLCIKLCRISTREEEAELIDKMKEFKDTQIE